MALPLPACLPVGRGGAKVKPGADSTAQARQAWQVGPGRGETRANVETTCLSQAGGTRLSASQGHVDGGVGGTWWVGL